MPVNITSDKLFFQKVKVMWQINLWIKGIFKTASCTGKHVPNLFPMPLTSFTANVSGNWSGYIWLSEFRRSSINKTMFSDTLPGPRMSLWNGNSVTSMKRNLIFLNQSWFGLIDRGLNMLAFSRLIFPFNYLYACVAVWVCVHMRAVTTEMRKVSPLEQEL